MDCLRCELLPRSGVRFLGLVYFLAVATLFRSLVLAQDTPGQCSLSAGVGGKTAVQITPKKNSAELSCPKQGSNTAKAVPAQLGQDVCQQPEIEVAAGTCTGSVPFTTLFPQTGAANWWKNAGQFLDGGATLTIPLDSFPRYDQVFYVGCADTAGTKKCVITVTVTAAEGGKNGQVVTCAYNSNTPYQVTLSKQDPSFTLDCGAQAVFHPNTIDNDYCIAAPSSAGSCATKPFNSIFPKYNTNWWSQTPTGAKVFKIADGGFPTQNQTFFVGCSGPKGTAGASNYCSVQVTFNGSAAGGSRGTGGTGGGETVTTTTTKSDAYAVHHIGVSLLALAMVSGSACLI
ncbi:srs domain-containing protein [Cystoisospora suis]|uniref:Srs domain-containing protein n=1 Tax=Cystoisospora suis TaxID=483139 RepID=A0A2C6KPB1_9APIC|nr:srs domain-containing protein [Cystoisospora suis]